MVESNDETNDATLISNNSHHDNETHDLLSFDPINNLYDNKDSNSSNFLSSTSSPLNDQYWHQPQPHHQHPATRNWTPMQHQSTNLNSTILELQNTICLLNNRLGMLESTLPHQMINDTTPTKPSSPSTLPNLTISPIIITHVQQIGDEESYQQHQNIYRKRQDPPESSSPNINIQCNQQLNTTQPLQINLK